MDQRTEIDLKESAASLTMHGFGRLLSTKSKAMRCIWLLLMLFFVSLVILTVTPTVRGYFKSPSLTKQETVMVSKLLFPSVTICGPSLCKEKVKKYAKEHNITLKTNRNGRIENIHEVVMHSPSLEPFAPNISKVISSNVAFEKILVAYRGYCYKLNPNGTFIQHQAGPDFSLQVFLDLDVSNSISLSTLHAGDSVEVIIQDHRQLPSLDTGTVLAPVGHLTQIEIHKTEIQRLKPPYPSKCTNGENMELLFKGEYTISNCELSCFLRKVAQKCTNIHFLYNYLLPKEMKMPIAKTVEERNCRNRILKDLQKTLFASCNCGLPCRETKFRKYSSQSKWPSTEYIDEYKEMVGRLRSINGSKETEDYIRNNLIAVNVFFGEKQYKKVTEMPMYTAERFVGEIGGQMGIWLGASIFSLLELVYLLAQFVGVSLRKKEKKVTDLEESGAK
ncbi:acid-sensing ion channel 4-A-like [Rhopilema esculentum]|uniref:acid-sensing ion channel 4-A-like n=1 Tax=Rhopilema esculentum TaxID=499914 RepID=UPI0031E40850|eukprot:gene11423-21623_t